MRVLLNITCLLVLIYSKEQVSLRLGQNFDLMSVNKIIVDDGPWTQGDHNSSP